MEAARQNGVQGVVALCGGACMCATCHVYGMLERLAARRMEAAAGDGWTGLLMFGLAIHGGAGTLPRAEMRGERELNYRAGLERRSTPVTPCSRAAGTSLDAVTRAVVVLEDNPLFNEAEAPCSPTTAATKFDAAIMDGHTLRAGAVSGLTHVKNPIDLARAVMEHSEYVMLNGAGAEEFALSRGVALVPQSYFHTPERWRQLERVRSGDAGLSALTISHVGTVGAVALDVDGRLAAATSTGGMTGKR